MDPEILNGSRNILRDINKYSRMKKIFSVIQTNYLGSKNIFRDQNIFFNGSKNIFRDQNIFFNGS